MSEYLQSFAPEDQGIILTAYDAIVARTENVQGRFDHDRFLERRDTLTDTGMTIEDATVSALMNDPEVDEDTLKLLDDSRGQIGMYGLISKLVSDIDFELTISSFSDELADDPDSMEGRIAENFENDFFRMLGKALQTAEREGLTPEEATHATRMAAMITLLVTGIEQPPAKVVTEGLKG